MGSRRSLDELDIAIATPPGFPNASLRRSSPTGKTSGGRAVGHGYIHKFIYEVETVKTWKRPFTAFERTVIPAELCHMPSRTHILAAVLRVKT